MTALQTIFISHGSPTTALDRSPTHEFLRGLGPELGRPDAILAVSAHWETERPAASTAAAPATIHDFYGFPEPLYRLAYPAPGAPELAARAAELLRAADIDCDLDGERGLDHGSWIPLLLMYPEAEVPVAQLSIQHHLGAAHQLAVGRALRALRHDGVLVMGSGNITHNLQDAFARLRSGAAGDLDTPEWARAFDDWIDEVVTEGRTDELADYRARAPHAETAHPRDEHLLPLMTAAGAGGPPETGRALYRGFAMGSLSMAAYAFGETAA